jgi:hypothetical protein
MKLPDGGLIVVARQQLLDFAMFSLQSWLAKSRMLPSEICEELCSCSKRAKWRSAYATRGDVQCRKFSIPFFSPAQVPVHGRSEGQGRGLGAVHRRLGETHHGGAVSEPVSESFVSLHCCCLQSNRFRFSRLLIARNKLYELLSNCIPPEVIFKVGQQTELRRLFCGWR